MTSLLMDRLRVIKNEANCDGVSGLAGTSISWNRKELASLPSMIILIGGVEPPLPLSGNLLEKEKGLEKVVFSSLHVMGLADPLLPRSRALRLLFHSDYVTILEHEEGHHIPSIRTCTYHLIKKWIWEKQGCYSFQIRER